MTPIRSLLLAAQAARHDANLCVAESGTRFRATTFRQNRQEGHQQPVWTREPLSAWMSGPEMVRWLRDAAGSNEATL